jgi:hypothetical protein
MADYKEEVKEQYRVTYDQGSGAFRILDMWADDIRNLPPDATIPDNTPAMKVINSREVNALLGTVNKMGWIDKIFGPRGGVAGTDSYYAPRKSIQEVSIENITAIIQSDKDPGVTREGILAIREIINKI